MMTVSRFPFARELRGLIGDRASRCRKIPETNTTTVPSSTPAVMSDQKTAERGSADVGARNPHARSQPSDDVVV